MEDGTQHRHNSILIKSYVLLSIRKPCFWSPKHSDFDTKIGTKSYLETSPNTKSISQPSVPKKISKWGSQIVPKSIKCRLQTPSCPSCCSHDDPRCPQAGKIVARVPNWTNQACLMIGLNTQNHNINIQSNRHK